MKGFRFLAFRVDPTTGTAIEAAAAAAQVSLSGWIRNAVRAALPEGTPFPALPPSPPRRRPRAPDDDVAAVAKLTGSVGQLTGATIQLARSLREGGHVLEHETTETILRDLRAAQADLVKIGDCLRAAEASHDVA